MPHAQQGNKTEWYKDAVLYELHVRAFLDSNNGLGAAMRSFTVDGRSPGRVSSSLAPVGRY